MEHPIETSAAYSALLEDLSLELVQVKATKNMVSHLQVIFNKLAREFSHREADLSFHRKTLGVILRLQQAEAVLDGKITALDANRDYYRLRFKQYLEDN